MGNQTNTVNLSVKSKRTKRRNAVLSTVLIVALIITGIFAFLTAQDSKTNVFTVGKIDIELWENFNDETYDSSDGDPPVLENILPTQITEKEPWIKNTGNNDAYVFMYVGIPVARTILQNEDGTEVNGHNKVDAEMFKLLDEDGNEGVNDGWTLIKTFSDRVDDEGNRYNYYVYGYNAIVEPGSETIPLFNDVQAVNFSTNSGETLKIPINAYAIQTTFGSEEVTFTTDSYTEDELTDVWDITSTAEKFIPPDVYVRQEGYVTFAGYMDWESGDFIEAPRKFTWTELKNEVDADIYHYGTQAYKDFLYEDKESYEETISSLQASLALNPTNEYNLNSLKDAQRGLATVENAIDNICPITDTTISTAAFSLAYITDIVLPEDMEVIGDYSFAGCQSYGNFSIPDTVTYIGAGAFRESALSGDIVIPDGVDKISEYAFINTQIESITLPNSITKIEKYAFSNCECLNSVNIPSSVKSIEREAFEDVHCTITIPDTVQTIEQYAFAGADHIICSPTVQAKANYPWGAKSVN